MVRELGQGFAAHHKVRAWRAEGIRRRGGADVSAFAEVGESRLGRDHLSTPTKNPTGHCPARKLQMLKTARLRHRRMETAAPVAMPQFDERAASLGRPWVTGTIELSRGPLRARMPILAAVRSPRLVQQAGLRLVAAMGRCAGRFGPEQCGSEWGWKAAWNARGYRRRKEQTTLPVAGQQVNGGKWFLSKMIDERTARQ